MTGYLHRIAAAVEAGHVPRGAVTVEIVHQPERCRHNRTGQCTCFPRITAYVDGQILEIGNDGAITHRSRRQ